MHQHFTSRITSSRRRDRDTQPIPEGLLSTQDTLAALGISEQTLTRRRKMKLIEAIRLKGDAVRWQELYYRIEDVERLKRGGSNAS